jgi:hypothetical protein
MVAGSTSWWFSPLLALVLGAPWIAATAWAWRRRVRDGAVPQSMADMARRRLWTR